MSALIFKDQVGRDRIHATSGSQPHYHPPDAAAATLTRKVGKRALNYLGRRPLKLVWHTMGTTFYHMGPLPPIPDSVHQIHMHKRGGGEGVRVWVDDVEGLLGLVEMDAVELHPWAATVDDIEHPDRLVLDLDTGQERPGTSCSSPP